MTMRVLPEDSLTRGRFGAPRRRGARPGRKPSPRLTRLRAGVVRSVARVAVVLLAAWVLVTAGAVASLRWLAPPASAVMLLEPGPFGALEYRWTGRSRISSAAARAVIAAEDQKFLEHRGFDLEQIDRALEAHREGARLRGASTITQQVAKNLFLWPGRSFVRKGLEAYFAVLIEAAWPKERILEVYLNIAEFGPGVFGVEAAAERLLGTSASRLTVAQASTLAAVLPSPKRLRADEPGDDVRARSTEIERQMRLLEERGHYRGLAW